MNNPIYIHCHIPKTAGATLNLNICHSLRKYRALATGSCFRDHYFNCHTKKYEFFDGTKESFQRYVNSLSPQQKKKIVYLYGHDSYYGIHKSFLSEPRYFAFFRDPVKRAFSFYNFHITYLNNLAQHKLFGKLWTPQHYWYEALFSEVFYEKGKRKSFEEWASLLCENKYPFIKTMNNFLIDLGYTHQTKEGLEVNLDKFFFVGLTETFAEDSLFLYDQLGVNYFFSEKNDSTSVVTPASVGVKVIKKLEKLLEADIDLYQRALAKNQKFKQQSASFSRVVQRMRKKQKILTFLWDQAVGIKNQIKKPFKKIPFIVALKRRFFNR